MLLLKVKQAIEILTFMTSQRCRTTKQVLFLDSGGRSFYLVAACFLGKDKTFDFSAPFSSGAKTGTQHLRELVVFN